MRSITSETFATNKRNNLQCFQPNDTGLLHGSQTETHNCILEGIDGSSAHHADHPFDQYHAKEEGNGIKDVIRHLFYTGVVLSDWNDIEHRQHALDKLIRHVARVRKRLCITQRYTLLFYHCASIDTGTMVKQQRIPLCDTIDPN
jgi:hypothetical protein